MSNYNTSVGLWINELAGMKQDEAGPVVIDDGYVIRAIDCRDVIARFSNTADAVKTLRAAGFTEGDYKVRS